LRVQGLNRADDDIGDVVAGLIGDLLPLPVRLGGAVLDEQRNGGDDEGDDDEDQVAAGDVDCRGSGVRSGGRSRRDWRRRGLDGLRPAGNRDAPLAPGTTAALAGVLIAGAELLATFTGDDDWHARQSFDQKSITITSATTGPSTLPNAW